MVTWYYAREGQQHGPLDLPRLQQLAATGTVRPQDLVWAEGMAEWRPAGDLPVLFAAAAPAVQPFATGGAAYPHSHPHPLGYPVVSPPAAD